MGARISQNASLEGDGRVRQDPERITDLTKYLAIKSEKSKSLVLKQDEKQEKEAQNVQMLRGMFKKLDPSVMKFVGDQRGDTQLSFKYDAERELLFLKVIKCRDLMVADLRSRSADPYMAYILKLLQYIFQIQMYPDPSGNGQKRTKVIHDTSNPRFDDIFYFGITEVEMAETMLLVQVWDSDTLGNDDFLGEVIIKMNTFNFRDCPIHTAWYTLNSETDLSISGGVEVSLDHQLPQRLFVTIHSATDLVTRDPGRQADPFVKITIPGLAVVHQTKVKKNTLNPVWEETFEFPIALDELAERYLVLHVVDHDRLTSNDSMGQIVIDLKDFDPDEGFHDHIQLSDLKNTDRLRNKWSRRAVSQEFHEALIAHSVSKQPSMLFQQHTGRKVVSVYCRKAGAEGKIRIVDGIPVF
ncbi:hypothetical protein ScPMuIL_008949 [Solemya velum]